ncbi:tannase and feruloyl esterase [Annulohypoxylon maeteangense]|uniref:tannase and feruloyl esterase n=1 Tax=Annulohypoxylon maeteangense TaxID=1927788 RepID=UPI002007AEAE|nr:tannase and feruloyl esterase [Annulohypoxylon maeteangense]KAI0885652.1 tannase and feruloyl esterase [Annulohypoxylon maeteangense]
MSNCNSSIIDPPTLSGAVILLISSQLVTNYSRQVTPVYYPNHDGLDVKNSSFCNITVSYTHPDQSDVVSVEAWLPIDNWNGRLQVAGGSGLGPGRVDMSYGNMAGAVGEGYATASTDAGIATPLDPYSWVLDSPGKIDEVLVRHWGGDILNDMAVIAKSVIQDFYGRPPDYSYFNGCSQGGRQGFELAQNHPDAYDGIAASAPAIHWAQWAPAMFWPQMLMNTMNEYPHGCELDFLTTLAVQECDGDDGIVDGIISSPKRCSFNPFPHVGVNFTCFLEGRSMELSRAAAVIANASWTGPTDSDGNFIWYGLSYGTDLSGDFTGTGIAAITCTNSTCKGNPVPLAYQWIQLFVEKNPDYDYTTITRERYDEIMRVSGAEYDSIVASGNPNLTEFYRVGGKMMTYHGLYDQVIPIQATEQYYDDIRKFVPDVQEFYRFYEVPGLSHCFGNGQPTTVFDALRAWVENGTVPSSLPIVLTDVHGEKNNRIICPYPETGVYIEGCGNPADVACFTCAAD